MDVLDLKSVSRNHVFPAVKGETLAAWAKDGRVDPADLVSPPGKDDWRRAGDVEWLQAPLAAGEARRMATAGDASAEHDDEHAHVAPIRRPLLEDVDLDMTPMIDVTFQLLIFFMLTNSMVNPAPLVVPETTHGRGIDLSGKQVVLVDDHGRYYLGESTREENVSPSLDALLDEVSKNAGRQEQSLEVVVTAHKQARHLQVRELVERLEKTPNVGPIRLGVEERK